MPYRHCSRPKFVVRISANLGFLWADQPLPEGIRRAGKAGFKAVECHMPYATPVTAVTEALDEVGLPMVSLNTRIGDQEGDFGVAALPGRTDEARRYIDEAVAYAREVGCANVSVVAGKSGRTPESEAVYRDNLRYAAQLARPYGITILIEPLNTGIASDYHLIRIAAGVETIRAVGADNLKLMVDCFHSSIMEDNLQRVLTDAMPYVGHIQFAAIPDRGEPDSGEIDYAQFLPAMLKAGYQGYFGAEYTPRVSVDAGLSWLEAWKT